MDHYRSSPSAVGFEPLTICIKARWLPLGTLTPLDIEKGVKCKPIVKQGVSASPQNKPGVSASPIMKKGVSASPIIIYGDIKTRGKCKPHHEEGSK
jgi:hypothetical protein